MLAGEGARVYHRTMAHPKLDGSFPLIGIAFKRCRPIACKTTENGNSFAFNYTFLDRRISINFPSPLKKNQNVNDKLNKNILAGLWLRRDQT